MVNFLVIIGTEMVNFYVSKHKRPIINVKTNAANPRLLGIRHLVRVPYWKFTAIDIIRRTDWEVK